MPDEWWGFLVKPVGRLIVMGVTATLETFLHRREKRGEKRGEHRRDEAWRDWYEANHQHMNGTNPPPPPPLMEE